jgi:hypothetical protein
MNGKIRLAVWAFCATCLSACATSEHQACRFGDPFDSQPARHDPAHVETQAAAHAQAKPPVQQPQADLANEPPGQQMAQSTPPLDSSEPEDEQADEKLDWFKPIRLGN